MKRKFLILIFLFAFLVPLTVDAAYLQGGGGDFSSFRTPADYSNYRGISFGGNVIEPTQSRSALCPPGYTYEYVDNPYYIAPGGTLIGSGDLYTCFAPVTSNQNSNVTATLVANPNTINPSEESTLTWSSTNAATCSGVGFTTGGSVSGSTVVTPSITTTYSVMCTGVEESCVLSGEDRAAGEGKGKSIRSDCSLDTATASAQVAVSVGVDLTPSKPSLKTGSLVGEGKEISFKSDVSNVGSGDITVSIPSMFELDINNDGTYDLILTSNSLTGLSKNARKEIRSDTWTTVLGTHSVRAVVDATGSSVGSGSGSFKTWGGLCEDWGAGAVPDFQYTSDKLGPLCADLIGSTWTYAYDDVTDYTCPLSQAKIDSTYSFFQDCPTSDPEGLRCSSLSMCKINSEINTCRVETEIYRCSSGGTDISGSQIIPGTITETNEINNYSTNYVFTVGEPQCSDGIDNDRDGYVDYPDDTDCTDSSDLKEGPLTECSDGIDNDNDGLIDLYDNGCISINDNNEINALNPQVSIITVPSISLVRKGSDIKVVWEANDVISCTVNGPSISKSYSDTSVSDQGDVEVKAKSTYTIVCDTDSGVISDSVTIGIVPSFIEE